MRAKIEWVRHEDGGRLAPPLGEGPSPYSTVVRFAGSNEPWPPTEAWSLVVEKIASDHYTWEADVRFLVDDAPAELLTSGRGFELFEGNRRVAIGTVQ